MSYFKNTPCVRLTEQEKRETIETVERIIDFLSKRYRSYNRPDINSINDIVEGLRWFNITMTYTSVITTLIKGKTQPKYLYRERRKYQIYLESKRIAEKTGADVKEIEQMFLRRMRNYILQ